MHLSEAVRDLNKPEKFSLTFLINMGKEFLARFGKFFMGENLTLINVKVFNASLLESKKGIYYRKIRIFWKTRKPRCCNLLQSLIVT